MALVNCFRNSIPQRVDKRKNSDYGESRLYVFLVCKGLEIVGLAPKLLPLCLIVVTVRDEECSVGLGGESLNNSTGDIVFLIL